MAVRNLHEVLSQFSEHWSPKIVTQINDYDVRVAKVQGEFVWHEHETTDEFFMVISGELTIQIQDRDDVVLGPNDVYVVPRGIRHRTLAANETAILMFEPSTEPNTGDAGGDRTAVITTVA